MILNEKDKVIYCKVVRSAGYPTSSVVPDEPAEISSVKFVRKDCQKFSRRQAR